MKISKLRFLISAMMTFVMTIGTMQVVKAWGTDGHWLNNTQYYRYSSAVPASYRTYINNGANAWTNVTPSHWSWNLSTSQGMWVYYQNIDGQGNTAAQVQLTILFGIITSANMTFDSSENWYAGTGVPGGSQADLRSAATHEMGHGLGLKHTSGIYCPGNTNNATMCLSAPLGSYYWRTLEGDDRNGVNTIYP